MSATPVEERRDRFAAALADLPVSARRRMLASLDEFARPMTVREIERALRAHGLSRTAAAVLANALRSAGVVLIAFDD